MSDHVRVVQEEEEFASAILFVQGYAKLKATYFQKTMDRLREAAYLVIKTLQ